jgi:hypothetical protein
VGGEALSGGRISVWVEGFIKLDEQIIKAHFGTLAQTGV